jgi:hypothetical protein
MSNAVAGVIGAMVTLAVVLGVELLVIFFGGLTLRKKGTDEKRQAAIGKDAEHSSVESGVNY